MTLLVPRHPVFSAIPNDALVCTTVSAPSGRPTSFGDLLEIPSRHVSLSLHLVFLLPVFVPGRLCAASLDFGMVGPVLFAIVSPFLIALPDLSRVARRYLFVQFGSGRWPSPNLPTVADATHHDRFHPLMAFAKRSSSGEHGLARELASPLLN